MPDEQAAYPVDALTPTTDADLASPLPGDSPVPPGDDLGSLACVYISAGVVRDLAAGFGHAGRGTCGCAALANGDGPAPRCGC